METKDLIKALATDRQAVPASLSAVWWGAGAAAAVLAAAVFFSTIGPRPDITVAAETPRFLFKFVVTLALAVGAFVAERALSRPGEGWRRSMPVLLAAPTLLAVAVVAELVLLPAGRWEATMVGSNALVCLTYIPLIGIGPLAIFLAALRHGAPTRPVLAGAVAGVLAGGVAATFYAAHCTDDSPLFVVVWYSIAIAMLAALGAIMAPRIARW